jgi:hypothetical protein
MVPQMANELENTDHCDIYWYAGEDVTVLSMMIPPQEASKRDSIDWGGFHRYPS